MTEEVKTISFNEKEYQLDEISDKAKYIISQLQDLQQQSSQLRAKLDQVEISSQGFTTILGEALEPSEEPEEVEGEVV
jgi:prefoldin subunit 5